MYSPFDKFPIKKPAAKRRKQRRKPVTQPAGRKPAPKAGDRRTRTVAAPGQSLKRGAALRSAPTWERPASLARRRRRRIRWGRLAAVLAAAVGLGYLAAWLAVAALPAAARRLAADAAQIVRAATPLPYTEGAYATLSRQIRTYLQTQPGTYGVSGVDLTTGAWFGANSRAKFTAAGTMALPVAMTLYNGIVQKTVSPAQTVRLTPSDEAAGPGYVGGMPYGTPFTVAQLARAAIVNEDTVATNMLIRALGQESVDSFTAAAGIGAALSPPYVVSPRDLTLLLDYLYTMDRAHPALLQPLMNDLYAVPPDGRLAAGFPPGTRIAQVQGNWPNEFHDSALIWSQGRPLALTVCSDGVTSREAAAVESHIARLTAQFERTGE